MGVTVYAAAVGQVVRHLPGPLVSLLDAWSHRLARRRDRERQRKWLQRQAVAVAAAPGVKYQLKPWRD